MKIAKTCSSCKEEKLLSFFSAAKTYADGYRGQCKKCRTDATKRYKARTGYKDIGRRAPARKKRQAITLRRWKLKHKYGITIDQYEQMVADQNGRCAICQQKSKTHFAVDHCHDTGRIRGLLCFSCNTGIGILGDRPGNIQRALDYITRTGI